MYRFCKVNEDFNCCKVFFQENIFPKIRNLILILHDFTAGISIPTYILNGSDVTSYKETEMILLLRKTFRIEEHYSQTWRYFLTVIHFIITAHICYYVIIIILLMFKLFYFFKYAFFNLTKLQRSNFNKLPAPIIVCL